MAALGAEANCQSRRGDVGGPALAPVRARRCSGRAPESPRHRSGSRVHQRGANYGGRRWEIDILAVNGPELVAVEVKTTLKVRDVDHFVNTLRHITELMPEYASRAVYGAVAYLKADESSDTYAQGQGLFVIRATGSSASITNHENFRPRTFGRVRSSRPQARS